MDILSTPLQAGAFGLVLAVLVILAYVVKVLLRIVTNDLKHIQSKLDSLPCMRGRRCPTQTGGSDDAP